MRLFTEEDLRRLAGAKSFARGQEYRETVMEVRRVRGGVTATVPGTHDYTVRLSHDGSELAGTCTCPVGEDGVFCKHCVALGLALLSGGPDAAGEDLDDTLLDGDGDGEDEQLRAHLEGLNRDALAGLLWEHAAEDASLYQRLALHAVTQRKQPKRGQAKRAGARKPAGPDVSALRAGSLTPSSAPAEDSPRPTRPAAPRPR